MCILDESHPKAAGYSALRLQPNTELLYGTPVRSPMRAAQHRTVSSEGVDETLQNARSFPSRRYTRRAQSSTTYRCTEYRPSVRQCPRPRYTRRAVQVGSLPVPME